MDKKEKLQALLRLKRHEQPPEGFAEEFLEKFQRRQRTELVRRSALSILWERSQAWLEGLRRPVVVWSAAGAYAAVMLALWLIPRPAPRTGNTTLVVATSRVNTPAANSAKVDYSPRNTGAVPVNADVPGKRRTPEQPQEKQNIIGPETKPDGYKPPPLREL
jgi:hypothetical protein